MLTSIYSRVRLVCGNHPSSDVYLVPHEGNMGQDMFYACPKYYAENRSVGESQCMNRISLTDLDKIIMHISDVIEQAEENGSSIRIEGMCWKTGRGIECRVLRETKDHIDVAVINRRVLR